MKRLERASLFEAVERFEPVLFGNCRNSRLQRVMYVRPVDLSRREQKSESTAQAFMKSALIAIVYHSGYGHTRRQAEAVKRGVEQVEGAEALLLSIEEAQMRWSDLACAEAIIFGAPTYTGGVSSAFKSFQEASSHAVMIKGLGWKNKIAAGFTNSGSRSGDKLATLIEIALFAAQHGMHWVNLGLPPGNHSTRGSEHDLNRLGFWLGAGAQSNTDQGPDLAPPEADLRTAEHLGRRVAETTLQWVRGCHARGRLDEREKLCSDVEMRTPAAS